MSQPDLFSRMPPHDGPDLSVLDQYRLTKHLDKVRVLMSDGQPRTLAQIAAIVVCSEAGASARLRDLRKPKFGGYTITRSRVSGGVWLYRMEN